MSQQVEQLLRDQLAAFAVQDVEEVARLQIAIDQERSAASSCDDGLCLAPVPDEGSGESVVVSDAGETPAEEGAREEPVVVHAEASEATAEITKVDDAVLATTLLAHELGFRSQAVEPNPLAEIPIVAEAGEAPTEEGQREEPIVFHAKEPAETEPAPPVTEEVPLDDINIESAVRAEVEKTEDDK